MRITDENENEDVAFNLAPMIDVVFLLLIFFMVATTFVEKEKELGVELPTAESGDEPAPNSDEIVINLTRDGRILMDGDEYDAPGLLDYLSRAARRDPETPVTIRGDKQVFHEHVVSVMDTVRSSGLINMGVMTLDG